jgi:ribulose-5-phosphate 4-epimerase/fuculose-1-phosphate aldolase
MRWRPDVNSVVHTHPLHSSCSLRRAGRSSRCHMRAAILRPRHQPFPDGCLRDHAGAGELAETLGDRLAVLMPRHGITTVGRDVGEAVTAATHLERACQLALLAGPNPLASPDDEALGKRERSYRHLSMAGRISRARRGPDQAQLLAAGRSRSGSIWKDCGKARRPEVAPAGALGSPRPA